MRRLSVLCLISVLTLLLPVAAFAGDQPLPDPIPVPRIECAGDETIDDAPVLPEGAPVDCVTIELTEGDEGDPCAPASDGSVPVMCQGQVTTGDEFSGASYTITGITLPDGTRVTISDGWLLIAPGVLTGSAGCNTFAGEIASLVRNAHDDLTLTLLDGVAGTEMACEGRMIAEAAFTAILISGPLDLSITDDTARLTNGAGQILLRHVDGEIATGEQERGGIALLLLVIPLLVGAVGIAVALSTRTGGR